jgi:DNA-binding transcriptional MerR regulator
MSQSYSMKNVAEKVGVAPFRINYAITNGLIPEPVLRFAGKRVFSEEDLARIANHFQTEIQNKTEESKEIK